MQDEQGPANVIISRGHYEEILAHAREGAPEEVCGLLGGRDGRAECLYRAENADTHRVVRYAMDPAQIWEVFQDIESKGLDLVAIYHSHPHSEARPSYTDVELAHYPDSAYIIVSLREVNEPAMRAYSIRQGKIVEIPLVVEES